MAHVHLLQATFSTAAEADPLDIQPKAPDAATHEEGSTPFAKLPAESSATTGPNGTSGHPASATHEGLDEYLPRSALSGFPSALEPIFVPYPEGVPYGDWRVIFTLFIDTDGSVRHVRSGTANLPAALEQAARQAFATARFKPGEVDGQPVKSRIRVEVEFSASLQENSRS